MSLYALPPLLTGLVVAALGLFVWAKRPAAAVNRAMAGMAAATAVWQFVAGLTYAMGFDHRDAALQLMRLSYSGVILIVPCMIFVVVHTVGLTWLRRMALPFLLIQVGFIATIWTTPWFIEDLYRYFFGYYPNVGWLHPIYLLQFNVGIAAPHYALFLAIRNPRLDERTRHQAKYLWLALGTFSFAIVDYLPNYGIEVYPFASAFILAFVAATAYAIVKHQLLDIRVAITRTGLMLAIYLLILGVPLGLCWWGEAWLRTVVGPRWWFVPVVLSTSLATVGPFLYAHLRRHTEELLLKELTRTRAQAATDALTGTLTRRAFLEEATRALESARRLGRPISLLMIDLDHFKAKNDTYGHLIGDAVLQEMAARLLKTLRQGDWLGRYGGEEFVLLLDADRAQARQIGERLRLLVAGTPVSTETGPLTQTLSIGLAACPEDAASLEGLIARADAALYAAKRAGRDRVEVAS